MTIEKHKVVSIDYILTNDEGDILDTTQDESPLEYLHGANNLLPALESALEGKGLKARVQTKVSPEEGYGVYDEELTQTVPLSSFPNPEQIKAGTQFQVETSQGIKIATISRVENGELTVDLNHPLAGQNLNFDIQVVGIRDATAEEIENGHIHTEGCSCGHDH